MASDTVLLRCARPTLDGDYALLSLSSAAPYQVYLDVIAQELGMPVSSFEYQDDEDDRIVVSSDTDLRNMIRYYHWMQGLPSHVGPLSVFPHTQRPSMRRRNVLGLKINVDAQPPQPDPSMTPTPMSAATVRPASSLALQQHQGLEDGTLQQLELLGHGSGGSVYRAFHIPSHQIVAVKIIPLDATPIEQQKIVNELEILHQCRSPYIIGFVGAYFTENRIKICTEYMDGGSLDRYGAIPEVVLGFIVLSTLRGLDYLRSLKVMHRDLKPSNILINSAGNVKLCDFGVSTQLVQSVTRTFVGTNAYMAPERVLGQPYTLKSEVWSLGVSLVEMALGRFPYPSSELSSPEARPLLPIELLQCIVSEPPPFLPAGHFSAPLVDFVARCLVKEASQRPIASELLAHPLPLYYEQQDPAIVRAWLQQRRAQQP
eukprot:m.63635 g.63635  ORF g.63635 m.63635 type:complete len:429 (-) comp13866_c0_seq2:226-1512(-)